MYFFGDSFDTYALPADALLGYWDSAPVGSNLGAGRFSGSRAITPGSNGIYLVKSSGSNDAVHHIVFAYQQTGAVSGTTNSLYFTLGDGATAQCTVCVQNGGNILLMSGAVGGATLATYIGAVTAANTWYAFEVEVVINNTAGSFAVRKNGNTSNDFSATSLNTRAGTANNYANRLSVGGSTAPGPSLDDLLWRSDAASVPWVGDIRCYTRRPDTDASVAWTRPAAFQMQPFFGTTAAGNALGLVSRYTPFISQGGTIGSVIVVLQTGVTGNMKCAIYASTGGQPSTVLQSAIAVVNNPVAGQNTFTFSPVVSIAQGSQFFVAVCVDTSGSFWAIASTSPYTTGAFSNSVAYASFPVNNPGTLSSAACYPMYPVVTPTNNAGVVSEPQQDAAASYVYSSTVGQADLYSLTGIDSTPTVIVGVTTRALAQKSDAGTRIITADLQSGATKVSSSPGVLNSGVWGWVYRTDLTDPATGTAWTPTGVNNARIGVTVTS